MNRKTGWVAAAIAVAAAAGVGGDVMYPWAIPVERPDGKTCTAHVWIPPTADRVRGILIGGESSIAGDPAIRNACEAGKLAIIRAGIDGIFNYKTGPGPGIFLKALDAVAEATGYSEIKHAPYPVSNAGGSEGAAECPKAFLRLVALKRCRDQREVDRHWLSDSQPERPGPQRVSRAGRGFASGG